MFFAPHSTVVLPMNRQDNLVNAMQVALKAFDDSQTPEQVKEAILMCDQVGIRLNRRMVKVLAVEFDTNYESMAQFLFDGKLPMMN